MFLSRPPTLLDFLVGLPKIKRRVTGNCVTCLVASEPLGRRQSPRGSRPIVEAARLGGQAQAAGVMTSSGRPKLVQARHRRGRSRWPPNTERSAGETIQACGPEEEDVGPHQTRHEETQVCSLHATTQSRRANEAAECFPPKMG